MLLFLSCRFAMLRPTEKFRGVTIGNAITTVLPLFLETIQMVNSRISGAFRILPHQLSALLIIPENAFSSPTLRRTHVQSRTSECAAA